MKIVIATPLYPPDIAPSAKYAKELASRLSVRHEVTVVAYARFPEQIPGVRIVAVDRNLPLPLRLLSFSIALLGAARRADAIVAENGPSVELPVLIVSPFVRAPVIYSASDRAARERTSSSMLLRVIARLLANRSAKIQESFPPERPEVLPFSPYPENAMRAFDRSWDAHEREILSI